MASRKRGSVQVRGKSISVVIDEGEHPWRKCPTLRCSGWVFTSSAGAMACKRCEVPRPTRAAPQASLAKRFQERD